MGNKYVIISLVLFATAARVHGFVCPLTTCVMIRCAEITAASCIANDQVLMPYAGNCGCCPACVQKIRKGERCAGFLQLLGEPERAGCEDGTTCNKIADHYFICE